MKENDEGAMLNQFSRTELLFGKEAMEQLRNSRRLYREVEYGNYGRTTKPVGKRKL